MNHDFLLSVRDLFVELGLPVFIAFFSCAGFGIIFNIRGRNLFYASLCGAVGWMVYLIVIHYSTDMLACFLGGVAVSLYSELLARVRRTPSTCFLIVGLLPLVPGAGVYYTMKYFVQGQYIQFAERGINSLACAGAIALGVMWVISMFRMFLHIRTHRHKLNHNTETR